MATLRKNKTHHISHLFTFNPDFFSLSLFLLMFALFLQSQNAHRPVLHASVNSLSSGDADSQGDRRRLEPEADRRGGGRAHEAGVRGPQPPALHPHLGRRGLEAVGKVRM